MEPVETPERQTALIGHDGAEQTLARASAGGRLAHAWLFAGPDGVGKATLAYRFARHLLSGLPAAEDRLAAQAQDPASRVFRLVAGTAHPDLLTIRRPDAPDKAGAKRPNDLPIEQVRRIPGFLALAASGGGWRIVVVDEADRLTRNAANALLKVLEEPPARTVLMLLSAMPGRLLPTLRSRCRRLDLQRLTEVEMAQWLDASGLAVGPEDRTLLIGLAEGSPGRLARLIASDGAGLWRELGSLLAGSGGGMDWAAVHRLSERLARPNADAAYDMCTEMLAKWLQDTIRDQARGRPLAVTSARAIPLDRLVKVWEKAQDLFTAARTANLDKRTTLLQVFAVFETAAKAP